MAASAASNLRRVFYLDASAIVKLIVREIETDALRDHISGSVLVSSEVAAVEVPRAAHLSTGREEAIRSAEAFLQGFYLVAFDDALRRTAARVQPPGLRSLDAIHLASALRVRGQIDSLVAYDRRVTKAALEAGFPVEGPGTPQPPGPPTA